MATCDDPRFSSAVPACVKETCFEYKGVVFPKIMTSQSLEALENMDVRPDDLFLITYAKSGTTWMQQIVLLVSFEGDASKLEGDHVLFRIPFLEIVSTRNHPNVTRGYADVVRDWDSPRMMKSHALPRFLPPSIRSDQPKAKVIYVVRNPKDAAVSYYHFCRYLHGMPAYESWDVFFEEFIAGRAPQGSWFENVLPWWKKRHHPNVLFLKFEDMKKDPRGAVVQVARFMGKSLRDEVIDRIVEDSSFGSMKKSASSNPDFILERREEGKKEGASFMRKGAVGNWKEYFTEEQNRRFDELYEKEIEGTGLELQFE
ncbi:sulfotransferase 1A1-like [Diadema antillarum]|uniref:sulfotransferase 1A1-like n=1 Tax=Diadema antillarum TaxID=105358 RepID=UPI003A837D03